MVEAPLEISGLRTVWPNDEARWRAIGDLGPAFDPTAERVKSDTWLSNIDAMLEHASHSLMKGCLPYE